MYDQGLIVANDWASLRAARDEAARRWIVREPGPWGAAAPDPPEARYDE
jgi:hypothetical protein